MKVRLVSDLHLEWYEDFGYKFIEDFPRSDVLILAGDICSYQNFQETLEGFAEKSRIVLYILGNHEFYGSEIDKVKNEVFEVCDILPNVYWLDDDSVTLDGITFHGATLWFNAEPNMMVTDFRTIKHLSNKVNILNRNSRSYLEKNVEEGDIVITHHSPSFKSVTEEHFRSGFNRYFHNNLDSIIMDNKPSYWFHGHTHSSVDYLIEQTRIICNPFGYIGQDTNKEFDIDLEIEV